MIRLDNERSSGLIKGIPLGMLAPGVNTSKSLYLSSAGAAGDRIIDISVRSRYLGLMTPSEEEDTSNAELHDISEILQTISIPTVEGIKVDYDVVYRRSLRDAVGLSDLRRYEEEFWDDEGGGEALVHFKLECMGPWSLELESVVLERQVTTACR